MELLERLKLIIIASAEVGEVGCPGEWGFEELNWPGKTCVNSDCARCWGWSIEQAQKLEVV